jgi:hypothetical protein
MQQTRVNVPVSQRSFEGMAISFKNRAGRFKPSDALDFNMQARLAKNSPMSELNSPRYGRSYQIILMGTRRTFATRRAQAPRKEPVMSKHRIVFSHDVIRCACAAVAAKTG